MPTLLRALAAMSLALGAVTATAHAACPAAEHHQFDFWLGRWEVFTPDGKLAGENRIEAVANGCALLESWQGKGGFSGSSLNSYDATTKQWHQHWVDSSGARLVIAGGWDGRRMLLASPTDRISWTPNADGTVRQLWEQTADGGQSWKTAFDGLYKRLR